MRLIQLTALTAVMLTFITPSHVMGASQLRFERFGVVEPHDAPDSADELSVGWGRARFHWAMIQPDGPDQWSDAELSDNELAAERAAGRETIGLLIGIPEWARDSDG